MEEFIIKVENFKFGLLDKSPIADVNQSILLYREGVGESGSMIIDSRIRPLAADIRRGKYNKIAYLSLEEKSVNCEFQLAMIDYEFYFQINVVVHYSLEKVREYYFANRREDKESIKKTLQEVIDEYDKQYRIDQKVDLKNDLQKEVRRRLEKCRMLFITSTDISVEVDSDAQRILRSGKDKTIETKIYEDQTDIKVSKNLQDEKIVVSENRLRSQQIQKLQEMTMQFGKLSPIMEKYFNGKLDEEDLYKYIEKNQINDLNIIKTAVDSNLMTVEAAAARAGQVINSSIGVSPNVAQIETKPNEDEAEENIIDYTLNDEDYL